MRRGGGWRERGGGIGPCMEVKRRNVIEKEEGGSMDGP